MGNKFLSFSALLLCILNCEHVRGECTSPSFPSQNVVLTDSYITTPSFQDGATPTFECMTGHTPLDSRASRVVKCEEGRWTRLELNCTRKSCGSPPDFDHGKYEKTGILFGDSITPVCNTGYKLAGFGSQTRWCRDKGWDGRDPLCEVVKCEPPPSIENGSFKDQPKESYDYSEVVSYICNEGLSLFGNPSIYCTENGNFNSAPPKCVDGCPKPEIQHAIRIGGKSPPYKIGHFIDYKCINGYSMQGDYHILCTAEGWNPDPPKCIEDCRVPVFGGNVVLKEFHSSSFPHGSRVTFECKNGYEPVDPTVSNSVTCEESKWTSLSLTCKAIPTTATSPRTHTTSKAAPTFDALPTTTTAPKVNDKEVSSSPPLGTILGSIAGAFAGVALIGLGVFFFKKKQNSHKRVKRHDEETSSRLRSQ